MGVTSCLLPDLLAAGLWEHLSWLVFTHPSLQNQVQRMDTGPVEEWASPLSPSPSPTRGEGSLQPHRWTPLRRGSV